MNTVWSSRIQGTKTLFLSRALRFDDMFSGQYRTLFRIDARRARRILEIGCGPGALAQALRRWYPRADIAGLDRDSAFVAFARDNVPGVRFLEGDAAALPFADESVDVTVSYTVSEHIDPSAFYGEQRRVLKQGGVCLVLSSRRGVSRQADCLGESAFEAAFWKRVEALDDTLERYGVGKYAQSEMELPAAMARAGFREITTGYALIDLTPDDPKYPRDMALAMIEANRQVSLEAIDSVPRTAPGRFSDRDIDEMKRLANARFDARVALYLRGEKQWDTDVSVIMVVRGVR